MNPNSGQHAGDRGRERLSDRGEETTKPLQKPANKEAKGA